MTFPESPVPDEELPERQRTFLARLREHDKRVKVLRAGDRMSFHGPIIGDGPMPVDEPKMPELDDPKEKS